ncbi:MAG: PIG-L family deacetylase [Candidatus Handelsmanbacteria bacterium]|nr:PIG-L family deacetylase [Candidatus Handelsmanbacteria bacterium]
MNILAIGAHPDDLEYGCGGTLIQHAHRGDEVYLTIVTVSDKGAPRNCSTARSWRPPRFWGLARSSSAVSPTPVSGATASPPPALRRSSKGLRPTPSHPLRHRHPPGPPGHLPGGGAGRLRSAQPHLLRGPLLPGLHPLCLRRYRPGDQPVYGRPRSLLLPYASVQYPEHVQFRHRPIGRQFSRYPGAGDLRRGVRALAPLHPVVKGRAR